MDTDNAGAWLVALDIDGTTLRPDGSVSDAVIEQVRRLDAAGHEVMLATGRSAATTIPVLERLGVTPRFLVCSNGAITLHRDAGAPSGYRREWVESFDPTEVLQSIRGQLENARDRRGQRGHGERGRRRAGAGAGDVAVRARRSGFDRALAARERRGLARVLATLR
ncbi:MAG TPA: HAD hydrolase family protein [Baekduia sp.]|jgi:hypothetical protein